MDEETGPERRSPEVDRLPEVSPDDPPDIDDLYDGTEWTSVLVGVADELRGLVDQNALSSLIAALVARRPDLAAAAYADRSRHVAEADAARHDRDRLIAEVTKLEGQMTERAASYQEMKELGDQAGAIVEATMAEVDREAGAIRSEATEEASERLARASAEAKQRVARATDQADRLVENARQTADRLISEASEEAARLRADAREAAQRFRADAEATLRAGRAEAAAVVESAEADAVTIRDVAAAAAAATRDAALAEAASTVQAAVIEAAATRDAAFADAARVRSRAESDVAVLLASTEKRSGFSPMPPIGIPVAAVETAVAGTGPSTSSTDELALARPGSGPEIPTARNAALADADFRSSVRRRRRARRIQETVGAGRPAGRADVLDRTREPEERLGRSASTCEARSEEDDRADS